MVSRTPNIFISSSSEMINGLARSYNALHYSQKLREMLNSVYPAVDFKSYSKIQLHQTINDVLLKQYAGEELIKYSLAKEFFRRNVTAAFELKVNNSRVDFLTINGDTKSFEIKSNLDNLQKLSKQVNDYLKVFEYNYVVIDEKHLAGALKIIPCTYGIWLFKKNKKEIVRDANLNEHLDPTLQLNLFTKRELLVFYKEEKGEKKIILKEYAASTINEVFKQMLKKRYEDKWTFIKEHKDSILPIDLHFFYHNNISPNLIYGH